MLFFKHWFVGVIPKSWAALLSHDLGGLFQEPATRLKILTWCWFRLQSIFSSITYQTFISVFTALISLQGKLIFPNNQKRFPQRKFCLANNEKSILVDEKSKSTKPFSLELHKHIPKEDLQGEEKPPRLRCVNLWLEEHLNGIEFSTSPHSWGKFHSGNHWWCWSVLSWAWTHCRHLRQGHLPSVRWIPLLSGPIKQGAKWIFSNELWHRHLEKAFGRHVVGSSWLRMSWMVEMWRVDAF